MNELWSQRFLGSLGAMGLGSDWRPGRRSGRAGDILSFSLSKSVVVGLLQAPGDEPYRARVAMWAFGEADWARIERELARQTVYTAKLLAGELPLDIETVFDELELPLFPKNMREIAMDCTCPRWEVPCEHLTAVCHRLAERFDTDPFEIFTWRGRTRLELLDRLISLRTLVAPTVSAPRPRVDSFWGVERPAPLPEPAPLADSVRRPDVLLDQVPPPDLTVDGRPIVELLRPLYRAISTPTT